MNIKNLIQPLLILCTIWTSFLHAQSIDVIIDYKIQYFEGSSAYNPDNTPVYSVANAKASKNETNPDHTNSCYSSDWNAIIDKPMVCVTDPSISEETTIQPGKKYYGYAFADYPASYNKDLIKAPFNTNINKAKIYDIKSVAQSYKKSSVNFGGHYILCEAGTIGGSENDSQGTWEEISAIIIDVKTGIAYPTPLPGLGFEDCETGYSEKIFENTVFLYKKNSNLLITHECDVDSNYAEIFIIKVYKWNGTKFQLLDTKKGRKNNKN
jgi:hypothetical protein